MVWGLLVAREVVCIPMIVNWAQPRMFYRSIKSILKSGEINILKLLLLPLHLKLKSFKFLYCNKLHMFMFAIILIIYVKLNYK